MSWKNFELKVLYLARRLGMDLSELLQWKYKDVLTAMSLLD